MIVYLAGILSFAREGAQSTASVAVALAYRSNVPSADKLRCPWISSRISTGRGDGPCPDQLGPLVSEVPILLQKSEEEA
jgi:hypothetical protein